MDVMVWLLLVKQEYADRTGLSITSQVSVDRRRRAKPVDRARGTRRVRARSPDSSPGPRPGHPRRAIMPISQSEKAARFRALHEAPGAFVIPNPWDGGSARILAALGFQALATSSGAQAGTLGRKDGKVTRDEALAPCRVIVNATDLPVAADL